MKMRSKHTVTSSSPEPTRIWPKNGSPEWSRPNAEPLQLATFDVFDTVLTRRVGAPTSVFLLVGRRLTNLGEIDCSEQEFARVRAEAEYYAIKSGGGLDSRVSLSTIYNDLAIRLGATHKQAEFWAQIERTIEEQLLAPVPSAVKRIKELRDNGYCIAFLSDMYLSSSFIREQLSRHGIIAVDEPCYVSCEHGASKRSGRLFQVVLARENVERHHTKHYGNDRQADIRGAKRWGVSSTLLTEANTNRYELSLETHAGETGSLSSVMAGASRLARLNTPVNDAHGETLRLIAAGVIGPVLVSYVIWILRRAQDLGLRRLYFLSRDGQVLLMLARIIAPKIGVSCELRYLYGSRQSWNLPAVTEFNQEQLEWMWDPTDRLSVRSLLARAAIDPHQIAESLTNAGFTSEDWDRNIDRSELTRLRAILETDQLFGELVLEQARQKRCVLRDYFRQEGMLSQEDWAIVDLGWYGSLQQSLACLVGESRTSPLRGFYFGLRDGRNFENAGHREAFFFDERNDPEFVNVIPDSGIYKMLEAFCAGDHGTVAGFEQQDDQVVPVLTEQHNQSVLKWGLGTIRDTLATFTDQLLLDKSLVNIDADIRPALAEVLSMFWLNPSALEARAYGRFPWEDGLGTGVYHLPLAQRYDWHDVVRFLISGRWNHHRGTWYEASIGLTPMPQRIAMKSVVFGRRMLRPVKKISQRVIQQFNS